MKKSTRIAAICVLFFNALGALFGGGAMVYDPTGEFLGLPIDFLDKAPFNDFLIPGIILLTINGLFNLMVGILGIMKNRIFPELTMLCGVLLGGWLSIQIIMIRQFYVPAHLPYFIIAITLIYLGFRLRRQIRA